MMLTSPPWKGVAILEETSRLLSPPQQQNGNLSVDPVEETICATSWVLHSIWQNVMGVSWRGSEEGLLMRVIQ